MKRMLVNVIDFAFMLFATCGGYHRWFTCQRHGDCRSHPHPDHVRDLLQSRRFLFHECGISRGCWWRAAEEGK